jgi:hypothetical protein
MHVSLRCPGTEHGHPTSRLQFVEPLITTLVHVDSLWAGISHVAGNNAMLYCKPAANVLKDLDK